MWYIYTMEYHSALKRNKSVPFADMWIYLETVTQSEVSQKGKSKYCMLTHICGIQKNGADEPLCQAETEPECREQMNGHQVGIWGDELGGWD